LASVYIDIIYTVFKFLTPLVVHLVLRTYN